MKNCAAKYAIRLLSLMVWATLLCAPLSGQSNLKVSKIHITGNRTFDTKTLKSLLKSKEKKAFNSRFMKLDRVLLTNYYSLQGFLNVYVASTFRKEGDKIFLEYEITEGRRYYLKDIVFEGNELFTDATLRHRFMIKNGEPYQRVKIENGINAIENLYADNGKPYVVLKNRQETVEDSLIITTISIEEGVTVSIVDVHYEGLKLVKSFLIRRELVIKKKEVFSRSKIQASQRNIYSTGLFQFVTYRVDPLADDPSKAVLVWEVVEKKPIWLGFRFGVGFESGGVGGISGNITTFDFTAEAGHRNIAGTARSVSVRVVPSLIYARPNLQSGRTLLNPRNEFAFTYVEPWVLNTRTPGVFRLAWTQEQTPVSIVPLSSLSASFTLSHNYANRFWSYTAGVSFQRVNIEDGGAASRDSLGQVVERIFGGQDLIYAVSFTPLKDKRDNVLVPQDGYLTEFFNKFAYSRSRPFVAGRLQDTLITNIFYKYNLQWVRYQRFKLNKKWIMASRLRTGGVVEFGKSKDIGEFPLTERFYLGGANTIRGYPEQSIGRLVEVRDATDTTLVIDQRPVGGKFMVLGNVELRIPLIWLLQMEVFLDAGNVFEQYRNLENFSLKVGYGAGLAVLTPFGPIRFDYGFKMFPQKDESPGNFHIGISFAF